MYLNKDIYMKYNLIERIVLIMPLLRMKSHYDYQKYFIELIDFNLKNVGHLPYAMDKALKGFKKCAENVLSGRDFKWAESDLKNSVSDFTSFILEGEELMKQETADTAKNLEVVEYDDDDAQEISSFNE